MGNASQLLGLMVVVTGLCWGFSLPAKTILVGFGESFTLESVDFASPPSFSDRSRVVAEYLDPVSGQAGTVTLKVEGRTGSSITLNWDRVIKLYDQQSLRHKLLSVELAGGSEAAVGDLKIEQLTVDGVVCEAALYLCPPYVRNLTDQGDGSFAVDAVLGGGQPPKVLMEFTHSQNGEPNVPGYRRCRIHDFTSIAGAGTTSSQTFTFTVPNLWADETPTGAFIFKNKIGISVRKPDLSVGELTTALDNAVQDASIREFGEISRELKALTPDNPDSELIWDAQGRVKVMVWTGNYWSTVQPGDIITDFSPADDASLGYFMYVVPYGEAVNFMRENKFSLDQEMNNRLKLAQKLGLQLADGTTTRKTRFLIMWAPPESLFRPAPDGEVDDFEAQLARRYGQVNPANDWITKHYDWKLANSYAAGSAYPFTGFGYTYDWSGSGAEMGLSEFVILPQHEIEVIDNVLTADFFDRLDD